jgi:hypothetical protein
MKLVLGAIVVLIVIFFAVPMIAGGSMNACQALEKHNISTAASNIAGGASGPVYSVINSVGQSFATGQSTSAQEVNNHPNTPTAISCTISYWQSL